MMDKTISIVDSAYENQVNKYQYINAERFIFSPKMIFTFSKTKTLRGCVKTLTQPPPEKLK